MKGMAYCNECHMTVHVKVPTTSVSQVTGVKFLTCFETIHLKDSENE